ncbi:MAG: AarF/ABC1/UbiB kinase family protein [Anaerolineales bacterium]|nr:AarF/ABC1/UbiB kinase family protein [Anaerolineales bacterium]
MDKSRYRRILFFFGRVILTLLFWDVFLRWVGFRKISNRTRSKRLQHIAQDYHHLAVQMGGVLIKVGQFLSARADMLPEEITSELSGLQDEVPPEDFNAIRQLLEAELGGSLGEKFAEFDQNPLAAASLGQVHRARLFSNQDQNDRGWLQVVVKIQRPDIEQVITTDLAALRTVGSWAMRYEPIRRRADVPALLAEFSRILYEEIDYLAEGRNAETFAENFKDRPGVRIPGVVWSLTTRRVLTLEDVYAIKITDYDQITAAGISLDQVAERVFDIYLYQIFENGFFHADPHPGNMFVEPTTTNEAGQVSWQLTFVDFGMVGHVPPGARAGLRELAIGLATKDAARMVKSYQMLDVLLPSADLDLIAQADAKVFDRFWGKSMEQLREIPFEEMHEFAKEFRDLVYAMPFQVPQDIVFLMRTVAILAGICTGLYPNFNFWESLTPYASQLLAEQGESRWDILFAEAGAILQTLLALPRKMESALDKIERDEVGVRIPGLEPQLGGIELTLRRILYALIFAALLISGVLLQLGGELLFARLLYAGSVIVLVGLVLARPKRN